MCLTVVNAVYNAVMSFDAFTHRPMLSFGEKICPMLGNGLLKGRKSCLAMLHSGNGLWRRTRCIVGLPLTRCVALVQVVVNVCRTCCSCTHAFTNRLFTGVEVRRVTGTGSLAVT